MVLGGPGGVAPRQVETGDTGLGSSRRRGDGGRRCGRGCPCCRRRCNPSRFQQDCGQGLAAVRRSTLPSRIVLAAMLLSSSAVHSYRVLAGFG